jgi:hypothetical protein
VAPGGLAATLTGEYRCPTGEPSDAGINIELTQGSAFGLRSFGVSCNGSGEHQRFSVRMTSCAQAPRNRAAPNKGGGQHGACDAGASVILPVELFVQGPGTLHPGRASVVANANPVVTLRWGSEARASPRSGSPRRSNSGGGASHLGGSPALTGRAAL